jgi:hypothetical protein
VVKIPLNLELGLADTLLGGGYLLLDMALLVSNFTFLFQVDMVTPMCSQLTYEGLIDEVIVTNFGYCSFD